MYALSLHSHYRSNAQDDSLAQQVEHIPFKDGVLGSSPRRITKTKRKVLIIKLLRFSFYNFAPHLHHWISRTVLPLAAASSLILFFAFQKKTTRRWFGLSSFLLYPLYPSVHYTFCLNKFSLFLHILYKDQIKLIVMAIQWRFKNRFSNTLHILYKY